MSLISLAPELTDAIVDQLCDDRPSLKAMALTCRRFLSASRFHLFRHVEMKPHHFTTRPFPKQLAPLVKQLRLTGISEHDSLSTWGCFLMGRASIPPPLTSGQLHEGLSSIEAQDLDLEGVKSSSNSTIFAAVVTTPSLVDNVTSLCLRNCCIDVADPFTFACSLPRLRHMRFSALSFDNSRSMIRKIERASAASFWAYSPTTGSDWSTISERAVTDIGLDLRSIEIYETEWSEDLRLMMVSIFNRLADPSETFTFRVNVNSSDLCGDQDPIMKGSSPFQNFLKECGHKIRRLDLCLGSSLTGATGPYDRADSLGCSEIQLSSVFDFCPNMDALRLSGPLCGNKVVRQVLGSLRPNIKIISFGETGETLDKRSAIDPFLATASSIERAEFDKFLWMHSRDATFVLKNRRKERDLS